MSTISRREFRQSDQFITAQRAIRSIEADRTQMIGNITISSGVEMRIFAAHEDFVDGWAVVTPDCFDQHQVDVFIKKGTSPKIASKIVSIVEGRIVSGEYPIDQINILAPTLKRSREPFDF